MTPRGRFHNLLRFICFHNPFYLISAALMLFGFHAAFKDVFEPDRAVLLVTALSSYIMLLSLTAYFVVRYGKVWEDARSIVLIIVLMFLALSVSFDQICTDYPSTAASVLSLGLGLSIVVSEGLIRSLRLMFPWSYRIPFYLVLTIFFIYPLWLSPLLTQASNSTIELRVLAFPVICALAFLCLIPAIWQRSVAVRENGTPWGWPWYPWTVFGFLGFAVCLRSYVLTLSFQSALGLQSSFGGYYLVPFGIALLILLVEISLAERLPTLGHCALFAAPALVMLSVPVGRSEVFQQMLSHVVATVGSPIWLTLLALLLFYTYALLRGMVKAEFGLVMAMVGLTVVGRHTIDVNTMLEPRSLPLSLLAIVHFSMAVARRHSPRAVLASVWLTAAVAVAIKDQIPYELNLVVAYHLLLVCTLLIGHTFNDACGRTCHQVAARLVLVSGVVVVGFSYGFEVTTIQRLGYIVALCAVSAGHWWWLRERRWFLATAANGFLLGLIGLEKAFNFASTTLGPLAATVLGAGIGSFAVAALISGIKGGGIAYLRKRWRRMWHKWNVEPF